MPILSNGSLEAGPGPGVQIKKKRKTSETSVQFL